MIGVKVFGSEPPCVYCKRTEEAAKKAAARFAPGEVSVQKHAAHSPEAEGVGFTATPAVVVDGRVVSQGRVPGEQELEEIFRQELGG